jgi:hypothetical protein
VRSFDPERDALAATDAEGDKAALEPVPAHGVNELGGQDRAGCANRMPLIRAIPVKLPAAQ